MGQLGEVTAGIPQDAATKPSIEVCIVAYGSEQVIAQAIASAACIPSAAIALCDNSPDGSSLVIASEAAAKNHLPFRSMTATHNPGFGAGCNLLAQTSSADWLVFLNPDAEVLSWPWGPAGPDRWGIIGAEQIDSEDKPLGAYGISYTILEEIRRSWFRRQSRKPTSRGFVGGAAMAIERKQFLELRGFDERYFLFYEDIDLCMRANSSGVRVAVASNWVVRHNIGHSARRNLRKALSASYESGRRFHVMQGHSLFAYDCYVVVDSLARWLRMCVLRDPVGRNSYLKLMAGAARHAAHCKGMVEK